MHNNKVTANSFSIQLFGDWRYTQEDSDDISYTFFKEEGCGALLLSSYEKDSPITIDDILEFFEEINEDCLPHLIKRVKYHNANSCESLGLYFLKTSFIR